MGMDLPRIFVAHGNSHRGRRYASGAEFVWTEFGMARQGRAEHHRVGLAERDLMSKGRFQAIKESRENRAVNSRPLKNHREERRRQAPSQNFLLQRNVFTRFYRI